jgi:hypothetical protein
MKTRGVQILAWSVNGACCAYIAWAVYVVKTRVPVFGSLFSGLGVAIVPPRTMSLVTLSQGPVPVVLGGALILALVLKEIVLESPVARALLSMLVFIAACWLLQWAALTLFQPLYQTIQKIEAGA